MRRGAPQRFNAHPGELGYLADDDRLVLSGISAAHAHRLALVAGNEVEAYVCAAERAAVIENHALHPADGAGNVLLRVVPDEAWLFAAGDRYAPSAAVAFDLIESGDARSRRERMSLLRRQDQAAGA